MRMLDNENTTLEEAGFVDEDSILAEIRSRYSLMLVDSRVFHFDQKNMNSKSQIPLRLILLI